jgi:serine protease AprX
MTVRINKLNRRWQAGLLLAVGAVVAMPLSSNAASIAGPMASVIVRGDGATSQATVDATVAAFGGHMTREISILNGGLALVPSDELGALRAAPGITEVTPDGKLTLNSIGGYDPTSDAASLSSTTQLIGAQKLWANGITGKGVGVALIDTGVAPVQGLNGSGQVFNGPDVSFDSQAPALTYNDEYGHGTHMAGIIAGNDTYGASTSYANNSNQFTGVAPDSHIVNVKVADENGVVDVSQVLAAIDWVVQHGNDNNLNIRVLNLSFGTNGVQAYQLDPLAFAAEVAWNKGIVVVASAGNAGSSSIGLEDPAADPFVIAVGAADTQGTTSTADDTVASFSSSGNGTRNPDVVAPGVHIASLRDPGSNLDQQFGSMGTVSSNTRFFRGSGTSQATAIVSGAAALLLQSHPGESPNEVKYALKTSATRLANQPASAQGYGEINVAAANSAGLPPGQVKQSYTQSTGKGTLEGARGSLHVVNNGVALAGEQDIFGNAFNAASMASAEANGASWSGGTWNGASWSGASWSGASWSGASWSGASWSGASWSGASWSGASWSGASWSGASWSGTSWSGTSWSTAGWADYSWS